MSNQPVALGERVIAQIIEPETVSAGGILLAGSMTGSLRKGKVLSVGAGVDTDKFDVKVGDLVAFHDGHGEKVEGSDDVRVINVAELRYKV